MEEMWIGGEQIDLRLCLMDSAQCFHFDALENGFAGVVRGQIVLLWQEDGGVYARSGMDAAELRHFLDLDRDYGALAREFAHIPAAERAIALYPGLRVLNQDPWEALLTFILSANNNVRRIRSLVEALCGALGDKFALDRHVLHGLPSPEKLAGCDGALGDEVALDGHVLHGFPSPERLAGCDGALCGALGDEVELNGHALHGFPSPERLAGCDESLLRGLGVGYRAPYLIGTAQAVLDGFPLWQLKDMDYFEAHRLLTGLPGVGDKVADCVLLFGCGQTSAFPVDVWVEKLLKSWFGVCGCSRKKLMLQARELLGPHAGLLQQFLFHAARMGDIEL